jgi:hypothetical protein
MVSFDSDFPSRRARYVAAAYNMAWNIAGSATAKWNQSGDLRGLVLREDPTGNIRLLAYVK